MLKILFILLILIPISFINSMFWLVQLNLFLIRFFFIFLIVNSYIFINLSYFIGIDLLSYGLILLSLWICTLILTARESINRFNYRKKFFLFNLLILLIILYITFRSINLFYFYLFFEGRLIPTLFLIIGWGYQPERLQAGVYLLFYTLLASLPILVGIFYIYNNEYSLLFLLLSNDYINLFLYLSILLAFLVKIPIFLVHLWLPKAHVEAPIAGSIILAGIILKLGGYGIIRIFNLIMKIGIKFNLYWLILSLFGGFLVSLLCLRQVDLKSLIAYSSVSHIRIVIGGIITINYWGFRGSYTLMIAHGLCSSGLFCLANISYERTGRRRLFINKGIMNFIPSICLWWFLLSSSNIAAPPSLNLLGEISLLNRIIRWSWLTIIWLSLLSFFRAAYTLYLYSYRQHGDLYSGLYSSSNGTLREYLLLILHWIPLNILILKSEFCILWLYLNSL